MLLACWATSLAPTLPHSLLKQLFFSFSFFCGAGNWLKGLRHTKQVPYLESRMPNLSFSLPSLRLPFSPTLSSFLFGKSVENWLCWSKWETPNYKVHGKNVCSSTSQGTHRAVRLNQRVRGQEAAVTSAGDSSRDHTGKATGGRRDWTEKEANAEGFRVCTAGPIT